MEVPGKTQPSPPAPTMEAGLMQLHCMAQIPPYVPMHMSRYQQHEAQLHERRLGWLRNLVSESFWVKMASLNDNVVQTGHRMQVDILEKLFIAV